MIYNSLREIADRFDLFIFDAYGVFWEGNGFYPGSLEIMNDLIRQNKTVVVVSNSTALSETLRVNYGKRGMFESVHYNYFISSGDLLRQHLLAGDIFFTNCARPQKYFVIGKPHDKAFKNTKYQQVESMQEADFVYVGVPYVYADTVAKYPDLTPAFWPVKADENGNFTVWDTLDAKPFEPLVEQIAALNLPVLNANPDFTAKEGHPLIPNSAANFVVRNGLITQMLRNQGCEILEFGKPHKNIYDYVFKLLKKAEIKIDKRKTCMIGDTIRTDIEGGLNSGIAPILCIKTGVTAEAISGGQTVESLCQAENIDVKQIIQIRSVGGL